ADDRLAVHREGGRRGGGDGARDGDVEDLRPCRTLVVRVQDEQRTRVGGPCGAVDGDLGGRRHDDVVEAAAAGPQVRGEGVVAERGHRVDHPGGARRVRREGPHAEGRLDLRNEGTGATEPEQLCAYD